MFNKINFILLSFTFFSLLINSNCTQPTQNENSIDTLYISNIDTLRIFSKDTVFKKDTLIRKDTLIIKDTLFRKDTLVSITRDTIYRRDTLIKKDTTFRKDTLVSITRDTVFRKDTLIKKDTIFWKDTLILITRDTLFKKDTLVRKDTIYNIVTVRDTTYIAGGSRIYVYTGMFSTTATNVTYVSSSWNIQLSITIGTNWSGLTYTCPYSTWSSSTLIQDDFVINGTGWVLYGYNGKITIYDPNLDFLNKYWKIVLIQPL